MVKLFSLFLAVFCLQAQAVQQNPENEDPVQQPGTRKCDRNSPIEKNVTVENGVDGDTVYIRAQSGSYSVRMIGIDTPETHYMDQTQGVWGDRAAERLKELLPTGTAVTLEFSPSICDSYGRYLAHIFRGKIHVNRQLAQEGLAVNYCLYPSVAHCEEIGAYTTAAIKARKGMFTDSNVELPYDFRRRIAGRKATSYVGSTRTKEVVRPESQERVPVGERIFFSAAMKIPAPYRLVE